MREIIQHCGSRDADTLAITAATGIASVNIGGCTLHSWAGVGIGKETKEQLLGRLLGYDRYLRQKASSSDEQVSQNRVVARWRRVKTLIIDESMFCTRRSSIIPEYSGSSINDRRRPLRQVGPWRSGSLASQIDGDQPQEFLGRRLRNDERPFGGIQVMLSFPGRDEHDSSV